MTTRTRKELIAEAKPEHDKKCSCDPRWLMSCPTMVAAILALGARPSGAAEADRHRQAAIEAGAAALWANVAAGDTDMGTWAEAPEDEQNEARDSAAAVYEAIEPILRRAFAEEAAQAIATGRDILLAGEASRYDAAQADALDWAASEIRKIGGTAAVTA